MKVMVSGHRKEKLTTYSEEWIILAIDTVVNQLYQEWGMSCGLSGMASGVDLWFCEACIRAGVPYIAYIPFEGQELLMSEADAGLRDQLIKKAIKTKHVRNHAMVEDCEQAIVVWDGNKGGTHNCFQQLIEVKKDIWWINPVKEKMVQV